MMRHAALFGGAILLIVLAILAASALFTVHQTQQAIVMQFGNPKRVVQEPGLHVKAPFWQNVVYFDARVLDFAPQGEEIITSDQKRIVVDSFVRYRIDDPLKFFQSVGTETRVQSPAGGRGRLQPPARRRQ